jgi:hypothetical protein
MPVFIKIVQQSRFLSAEATDGREIQTTFATVVTLVIKFMFGIPVIVVNTQTAAHQRGNPPSLRHRPIRPARYKPPTQKLLISENSHTTGVIHDYRSSNSYRKQH